MIFNSWTLIAAFIGLLIVAMGILQFPFRMGRLVLRGFMSSILVLGSCGGYWIWGSWNNLQDFAKEQIAQQRAQLVLNNLKSPQELVDKLQQQLRLQPNSSQGWYLLGRLFASQQHWSDAKMAFTKAAKLAPNNEKIAINLIESLWQLNRQQFNDDIKKRVFVLLKQNPNQVDALSLLAMNAYQQHDYQQAIDYWTHLLRLAPQDSEDAKSIRKAIAKARALKIKQA